MKHQSETRTEPSRSNQRTSGEVRRHRSGNNPYVHAQDAFGNQGLLRRMAVYGSSTAQEVQPPDVRQHRDELPPTTSAGRVLDHVGIGFAERLGVSSSAVRVYEEPALRSLGAHALTIGTDILFAPGAYTPSTPGGQRLLAHELTHVAQQQGGVAVQAQTLQGGQTDPSEREADQIAALFTTELQPLRARHSNVTATPLLAEEQFSAGGQPLWLPGSLSESEFLQPAETWNPLLALLGSLGRDAPFFAQWAARARADQRRPFLHGLEPEFSVSRGRGWVFITHGWTGITVFIQAAPDSIGLQGELLPHFPNRSRSEVPQGARPSGPLDLGIVPRGHFTEPFAYELVPNLLGRSLIRIVKTSGTRVRVQAPEMNTAMTSHLQVEVAEVDSTSDVPTQGTSLRGIGRRVQVPTAVDVTFEHDVATMAQVGVAGGLALMALPALMAAAGETALAGGGLAVTEAGSTAALTEAGTSIAAEGMMQNLFWRGMALATRARTALGSEAALANYTVQTGLRWAVPRGIALATSAQATLRAEASLARYTGESAWRWAMLNPGRAQVLADLGANLAYNVAEEGPSRVAEDPGRLIIPTAFGGLHAYHDWWPRQPSPWARQMMQRLRLMALLSGTPGALPARNTLGVRGSVGALPGGTRASVMLPMTNSAPNSDAGSRSQAPTSSSTGVVDLTHSYRFPLPVPDDSIRRPIRTGPNSPFGVPLVLTDETTQEARTRVFHVSGEAAFNDLLRFGDWDSTPSGSGRYFTFNREDVDTILRQNPAARMNVASATVPLGFYFDLIERGEGYVFYDRDYGGHSLHVSQDALPELYRQISLPEILDAPYLQTVTPFPWGAVDFGRQRFRNRNTLSEAQLEEVSRAVNLLGIEDVADISRYGSSQTGYNPSFDFINIGSDVAPGPLGPLNTANARVSILGTLAHEAIGHREAALAGQMREEGWHEEAQASLRAALRAPGLSREERWNLIEDALERLRSRPSRDTIFMWMGDPFLAEDRRFPLGLTTLPMANPGVTGSQAISRVVATLVRQQGSMPESTRARLRQDLFPRDEDIDRLERIVRRMSEQGLVEATIERMAAAVLEPVRLTVMQARAQDATLQRITLIRDRVLESVATELANSEDLRLRRGVQSLLEYFEPRLLSNATAARPALAQAFTQLRSERQAVRSRGGGINVTTDAYFPSGDPRRRSGEFVLVAHGSSQSINLFGVQANPDTTAVFIREHPDYVPGMPVRLYSCWTGSLNFAQRLANRLNAIVEAPTTETDAVTGDTLGDGRWVSFSPQSGTR